MTYLRQGKGTQCRTCQVCKLALVSLNYFSRMLTSPNGGLIKKKKSPYNRLSHVEKKFEWIISMFGILPEAISGLNPLHI